MARWKAGETLFPAVWLAVPESPGGHCWGEMKPQQAAARPQLGHKRRQCRTLTTAEPRGSHNLALNVNPAVSLQQYPPW